MDRRRHLDDDEIEIELTPKQAACALIAVGAMLLAQRGIQAWQVLKARSPVSTHTAQRINRGVYEGGFQKKMTSQEAAMILGVSESAVAEKIKEAHRKAMITNHPDAGRSNYLASKINEAKDIMMQRAKENGSTY